MFCPLNFFQRIRHRFFAGMAQVSVHAQVIMFIRAMIVSVVFCSSISSVFAAPQAAPSAINRNKHNEPNESKSFKAGQVKLGTDLFPETQPEFQPFVWQAATPVAGDSEQNHRVAPDSQHRSRTPSRASRVQVATFQSESSRSGQVSGVESTIVPASTAEVSQDPDAPRAASTLAVETQIKKIEQSAAGDDIKAAANKHNQQAVEFLRLAEEVSQKSARLKEEIENGPVQITELRKRLAEPPEKAEVPISPDAKIAELEAMRVADESQLNEAKKAVESWEARARLRTERKPQMPSIIEKAVKQLAEARDAKPLAESVDPIVDEARQTEHMALTTLLQSQLQLYQIERIRYDALSELFPLQRDVAVRTRNLLEKRVEFWKTAILDAGKRESVRQAAEALRALQNAHPALRELAEKNASLTRQRKQLQEILAKTRANLNEIRKLSDDLEKEYSDVQEKEARVGLTTAIGLLLRNQRNHLPDESTYRQQRREAESEMTRLQVEQMPLDDERKKVVDPAEEAEQIVAAINSTLLRNPDEVQKMAFDLLADRQKYLDDILNDYDTCIKDLAELDIRCRTLIDTTVEYRNYIDARVLWVRSAAVVGIDTPAKVIAGIREIANGIPSAQIVDVVVSEASRSPLITGVIIAFVLLLMGMQSRMRNWISVLSTIGSSRSGPGLATSALALTLTVLVASVWPAILWGIGKRLSLLATDDFMLSSGAALRTTAFVFWTVEVFRQVCRKHGIAQFHLLWPAETVHALHLRLVGLLVTGLPFVIAVKFTERWNDGAWADSLGRVIFVAGMIVLAVNLRRIVRPNGPVIRTLLPESDTGWAFRTRYLWSSLIILSPLLLAILTLSGFQYTAEQLLVRAEATAWLFILLAMAFTLSLRWIKAARRRIALARARERRRAAVAAAISAEHANELPASPEEPGIDFSRISEQMLKLTRIAVCVLFLFGSWQVWAEVVPALQVFDRVELWTTTVDVAEDVETTDGEKKSIIVSRPLPVTLGSVMLAVGIFSLFLVASRNLPGLLELTVLQHLPMDDGGRHAITTLCRYALFATGMTMSAKLLGIGWSSVQWLVAALTVGLGFGLQEIFANFVSGLIILFERPVRIGDVVTIDNVSGKVSRIQIRATTITDFDRKEYIVPNKEFVTGRVLNWTLSDKTNRIVITVGVGYGQDTMLARALLIKVAKENAVVLDDPEPIATFEGFGDSCLTLLLRCFLPSLDDRLKVITELHEAIDQEFKAHGLQIAFPQRDLHIRTMAAIPTVSSAASEPQSDDVEQKAA